MDNKLQELTDRLYNEGLSKGRQEADALLARAKLQAEEIVAQARAEAEAIRAAAEKQAEDIRIMVEGDMKMASTQAISALKQQVENMIITEAVAKPVGTALSNNAFVQELILSVVRAFNASNPEAVGLDVILPESSRNDLERAFMNEAIRKLSAGIEVRNVKGLANGFRIGPKDGGYRLSFTGDEFASLIGEYLRPATRKILFG